MLSKCMIILRRAERLVWLGFFWVLVFLDGEFSSLKKCHLTPFKILILLMVPKLIVDPALFQRPGLQSP